MVNRTERASIGLIVAIVNQNKYGTVKVTGFLTRDVDIGSRVIMTKEG